MVYTLDIPIALGSSQTGLTLEAQLVNTSGADVGSAVTTGFTEIGLGNYLWHYASFPDGHRGGVKFRLSGGGTLKAFTAINPEEAENTDAKTSTRLAPTTAGRTLDVSAGGEAGVDWANVGSPTTVVGLSGTTVKTATDVETDTQDIQGRLPAALVSGRMDSSVGAMAADTLTASALAASAVSEIQSGLSTLDAAGVRSAVGLAAANLDTQLAAIAGYIDTEVATIVTAVAAIKAKTDNLPSDPADASDIAASFTSIASTLATIASYIDTEVAAIKAKTDNLPASPAATSDIPSVGAIADGVWDEAQSGHTSNGTFGKYLDSQVSAVGSGSAPTADEIADAVWDEPLSGHLTSGSTGAKLNAAGGAGGAGSVAYTYTVYEDDGTTPLEGCEVYVTTDSAGTNVVAGTLTTDAFGIVQFQLDPGTYYFWRKSTRFNFNNPDTEVVS